MSVKHNLEQWISEIDSDGMCDISDGQVIYLIRSYSTLEAKCAALAAENAALKDYLAPIGLKVEGIPATDAFLAEVRAQGVEMLLSSLPPHYTARADIENLASQLRREAAQ